MKYNILIVGSGVVGYATGVTFSELGHNIVFVDTDRKTVDEIRKNGYSAYSTEEGFIFKADIIFICTPTPLSSEGVPNINSILEASRYISKRLEKNHHTIVSIRSTVPVGTCKYLTEHFLQLRPDLVVGEDYNVCSNPEYLREKSSFEDFKNPQIIVIGSEDNHVFQVLKKLYKDLNSYIYKLTAEEAEMHKYSHNLYNASKIAFFNEQRKACKILGIDADRIFPLVMQSAEASWNINYGIHNNGPFGGHCLPKDTLGFLNTMSEKYNTNLILLRAIIESNKLQ